jgi:hypothetical protein
LELESIDLVNKTAKLKLSNTQFIADTWIYSKVKGIEFSENFENYLPGTHYIHINFVKCLYPRILI